MSKRKQIIKAGIFCAVLLLAGVVLAAQTLRSLGDIFAGLSSLLGENTADTMSAIFSQTKSAHLQLHVLIPVLIAGLMLWWFCRVRTLGGRVLIALCVIPAFLLIYLSALLLTRVNDIRFIDLVLSLAESISDGLFDSL